jgi:hypothetical protein
VTCYRWQGGRPCLPADSFVAPLSFIRVDGDAPHVNGAGTVTHYVTEELLTDSDQAPDRTRWLIPANDLCYVDTGTTATVSLHVLWTPYASWVGGVFPDNPSAPNRDVAEVGFVSLFLDGLTTIDTKALTLYRDTADFGVQRENVYTLFVGSSPYALFKSYLAAGTLAISVVMNPNGMERPVWDTPPSSYENGYTIAAVWTECGGLPPLRNIQRDDVRGGQTTSRQLSNRNAAYI